MTVKTGIMHYTQVVCRNWAIDRRSVLIIIFLKMRCNELMNGPLFRMMMQSCERDGRVVSVSLCVCSVPVI
jgi:hypothetical protein